MENKRNFVKVLILAYYVWFLLSFSIYVWLAESSIPIDYTSIIFLIASSYNFALITILGFIISCFVKEEMRFLTVFLAMIAGVMQLGRGFGFILRQRLDLYVYVSIISGIIGVGGFIILILYGYFRLK
jgi:hypothetical protein